MRRLIVLLAFVASACGSDSSPVSPTPVPIVPVVPACQSQNTSTVYFQNRTVSNLTYDIVWDGSRLTTVTPGKDTQIYTFAANVQHSLRFQITNTTVLACNPSTPVLTVCGATFYGCGT